MRVLLISNSGRPLFEHCRGAIAAFLGSARRVAFVTAASLRDEAAYYELARAALEPQSGLTVDHLRWDRDYRPTLERTEAVFVGGGNTYALLKRLGESGLLDAIRVRARAGLPYVGSSAGSNVAGPNILTTNDWNVVGLTAFDALGLVPFTVNPHYKETDPTMARWSETRDERIAEYLLMRDHPVVGIEEETLVRVEDGVATVLGTGRVKLFIRGREPRWCAAGARLAF
ncbi:MAG: dipeptidase PepE [Candidatus Rokubacteria bacterium]|nr:dipeptidase PepE [Candidatus Rokubacteria bacterium]